MKTLYPETVEQAIVDCRLAIERKKECCDCCNSHSKIYVTPTNELFLDLCERVKKLEQLPIADDELPVGSVVLDYLGDAWQRFPHVWRTTTGTEIRSWRVLNSTKGPLRVVRAGGEQIGSQI